MNAPPPGARPARPVDFRSASDDDYALLNTFYDALHPEEAPDDPLVSHDWRVRRWRSRPDFIEPFAWIVTDANDRAVLAVGTVGWPRGEENAHAAEFHVRVLPEQRRRGLARHLLAQIVDVATHASRPLLIASASDRVLAGDAFLERIGASRGLASHVNQLRLTELNHDAVRRWLDEAREVGPHFDLAFWTGPFPEEDLDAVAALHDVMNQAPRGTLDIEDQRETPERLRQGERSIAAAGVERWVAYVRDRATGAFAGFSAVYWRPDRPSILDQGDTGVFPRYRNRGLGRWLKAAMLDRILRERPEVELIRTTNADTNAPMLRINTELGFRPYIAHTVWQVETERVRRYLDQQGTSSET